ncbi:hypothetical protein CSUI_001811 [Cystoisospora suis]|uniref:Uncharacterized protein n=1 Tax=Cystoisospora suis TaxID=483139 RepID=A0A2C6KW58_9APIC|nr:hypothetical protein CSUI_001811 [Cystoisospora suis]
MAYSSSTSSSDTSQVISIISPPSACGEGSSSPSSTTKSSAGEARACGGFVVIDLQGEAFMSNEAKSLFQGCRGGTNSNSHLLPLHQYEPTPLPLNSLFPHATQSKPPLSSRDQHSCLSSSNETQTFPSSSLSQTSSSCFLTDGIREGKDGDEGEKSGEEKATYDTWALIHWKKEEGKSKRDEEEERKKGEKKKETSSFLPSRKCSMHVGSLVLDGHVESIQTASGFGGRGGVVRGFVVLRRVKRRRRKDSTRYHRQDDGGIFCSSEEEQGKKQGSLSSKTPCKDEEEEEETCWEVQAIMKEKVTFSDRPILHSSKTLFANRYPSVSSTSLHPSNPPHDTEPCAALPRSTSASSSSISSSTSSSACSLLPSSSSCCQSRLKSKTASLQDSFSSSLSSSLNSEETENWVVGISPCLKTAQVYRDWKVIAVDNYLLHQIQTGESVLIKRRKIHLPSPSSRLVQKNRKKRREISSSSSPSNSSSSSSWKSGEASSRFKDGVSFTRGGRTRDEEGREDEQEKDQDEEVYDEYDPHVHHEVETLLCCRDAVYTVNRNEIDGQLLIAFYPDKTSLFTPHSESIQTHTISSSSSPPKDTVNSGDVDVNMSNISEDGASTDRENRSPNRLLGEKTSSSSSGLPSSPSPGFPLSPSEEKKQNSSNQTSSSREGDDMRVERRNADVVGIPIVGVCESILLLESTLGRIDQISSLLSIPPSRLSFYLSSVEYQQLNFFRSHSIPYRIPSDISVFPSSLIFHIVQASHNEIRTALYGGARKSTTCRTRQEGEEREKEEEACNCSPASLLKDRDLGEDQEKDSRREREEDSRVGGKTEDDRTQTSSNEDVKKEFDSHFNQTFFHREIPSCWGGRSLEKSLKLTSRFSFFIPLWKGYISLSFRSFLKFFDRLLLFFTFADFSSSSSAASSSSRSRERASSTLSATPPSYLTIGKIYSLIQDMEKKGFHISPFTTTPQQMSKQRETEEGNAENENSSSLESRGETGGAEDPSISSSSCEKDVRKKGHQKNLSSSSLLSSASALPLDPGLLFQILLKFCDVKLPHDSLSPSSPPPLPLHYMDMCPPLPFELLERRTPSTEADRHSSTRCHHDTPEAFTEGALFPAPLYGIEKYEAFLSNARHQVNECRVYINWVKLHTLLALSIFYEEGTVDTVQCGMDKEEYLQVSSISLSSFCSSLSMKLQQLPLNVIQAADRYLDECLDRYCSQLKRSLDKEIEKKKREVPFCPHIDSQKFIENHLLHQAFHTLPFIRYALVKKSFQRRQRHSRRERQREEEEEDFCFELSDQELLQANTIGFPELRIPSHSPYWDKYDIQACLCESLRRRKDHHSASSSSAVRGMSGQDKEVYVHRREEEKKKENSMQQRSKPNDEISFSPNDGDLRGASVYKEAYALVKEKLGEYSSSLHLSILSGYAFYAEGKLVFLPEDHLPVHTRERLAVLFMIKSPWWDSELTPYITPTLLGKDLAEAVAGPPRRHCEARQLNLMNVEGEEEQEKDDSKDKDTGIVFFSNNLPLPYWDVSAV